jgi:hypothetical protein
MTLCTTRPHVGQGSGLGARWQGGGRVRVDGVRWRDRTAHLSAFDLSHSLQEA